MQLSEIKEIHLNQYFNDTEKKYIEYYFVYCHFISVNFSSLSKTKHKTLMFANGKPYLETKTHATISKSNEYKAEWYAIE